MGTGFSWPCKKCSYHAILLTLDSAGCLFLFYFFLRVALSPHVLFFCRPSSCLVGQSLPAESCDFGFGLWLILAPWSFLTLVRLCFVTSGSGDLFCRCCNRTLSPLDMCVPGIILLWDFCRSIILSILLLFSLGLLRLLRCRFLFCCVVVTFYDILHFNVVPSTLPMRHLSFFFPGEQARHQA